MQQILKHHFILGEGSINERIRRSNINLHPTLANAPLIYTDAASAMAAIYKSYIDIAEKAKLPIFIYTPTWRAGKNRVEQSEFTNDIVVDACQFMQNLRNEYPRYKQHIKIGGLFGPKNDCYTPSEALSAEEAETFHTWQIEELRKGEVDFLVAETIPALSEAQGIAKAAAKTNTPYIISFVIGRDGKILDGTNLSEAIQIIDTETDIPPIAYAINCAHPSFLLPEAQNKTLFKRLISFNANSSSRDHCDLENADCLQVDNIQKWGDLMLELNKKYGVKMLGGCCGAGPKHIQYLVDNY